jgi:hypothetical protein
MAEIQKVRDHTWYEVRKGKEMYSGSFSDPRGTTYQFDTIAQAKEVIKLLCERHEDWETFEFVVVKVHKKEVVVI